MNTGRIVILLALFVIGFGYSATGYTQEHDHQDWDLLSIGRIVTLARTNSCVENKTPNFACGVAASNEAITRMDDVLTAFDCSSFGKDIRSDVSQAFPLTRHDHGPLIVAEVQDVTCKTLPSTQLMPVDPDEFKEYCSRLEWKCDTIWIPDSDPTVWYIGVFADIPPSHSQ